MMLIDRMDVPLNKVDSTVVFTLYISILCGTLAVRTHYFAALTTISWIFLVMCLYYVAVSISGRETDTLVGKAKVQNIYLYFVLTLLFGLATILVNFKYVSNDELMVFLALMDAFTKGILTVLNLDCQLVRLLALESQFLIELEANKRRRQFMKYVSAQLCA